MKSFLLVLIVAGLFPGRVDAVCDPASAGLAEGREPPAANRTWSVVHVETRRLETDSVLLGLDGSRVRSTGEFVDAPSFAPGSPGALRSWVERVDWSAYGRSSLRLRPSSELFFDTDEKGARRLCRIESRVLTDQAKERQDLEKESWRRLGGANPAEKHRELTADELQIDVVRTFDYAPTGLLVRSLLWRRELGRPSEPWEFFESRCLRQTAAGTVTGFAVRTHPACMAGSEPEDIQMVHDAGGRLLRTISVDHAESPRDGVPPRMRVVLYREHGKPRVFYAQDSRTGRPYRLVESSDLYARTRNDILVVDEKHMLVRWDEVGKWSILTVPVKAVDPAGNKASYLPDPWTVDADGVKTLLSGTIREDGRIAISKDQRAAIWSALTDDASLVIFSKYPDRIVLVPAVANERWKSCLDPAATTGAACP